MDVEYINKTRTSELYFKYESYLDIKMGKKMFVLQLHIPG